MIFRHLVKLLPMSVFAPQILLASQIDIDGYVQLSSNYAKDFSDGNPKNSDGEILHLRRAKLKFGDDLNESWSYKLGLDLTKSSPDPLIEKVIISHHYESKIVTDIGLFKFPLGLEIAGSSSERSNMERKPFIEPLNEYGRGFMFKYSPVEVLNLYAAYQKSQGSNSIYDSRIVAARIVYVQKKLDHIFHLGLNWRESRNRSSVSSVLFTRGYNRNQSSNRSVKVENKIDRAQILEAAWATPSTIVSFEVLSRRFQNVSQVELDDNFDIPHPSLKGFYVQLQYLVCGKKYDYSQKLNRFKGPKNKKKENSWEIYLALSRLNIDEFTQSGNSRLDVSHLGTNYLLGKKMKFGIELMHILEKEIGSPDEKKGKTGTIRVQFKI